MKKMNLAIWTTKKMSFVSTLYAVPAFVVDVEAFALRVQTAHIECTEDRLNNAAKTAEEKNEEAKKAAEVDAKAAKAAKAERERCEGLLKNVKSKSATAKAEEELAKAAKAEEDAVWKAARAAEDAAKAAKKAEETAAELKAFNTAKAAVKTSEADRIARIYTVAFSIGYANIDGFDGLYADLRSYAFRYLGEDDKWTDTRKAEVVQLRGRVNLFLSDKFGTRDAVYKTHAIEFNARYFDLFVSELRGTATPKNGKIEGEAARVMKREPLKRDRAATALFRNVFEKYGCAPEEKEAKKFTI